MFHVLYVFFIQSTHHDSIDTMPSVHLAAEAGDLLHLQQLLSQHNDLNGKDAINDTPLHRAASCGHLDVVRWLLECGARPTARGCSGRTTLMAAARCELDNTEVMTILHTAGVEINALDDNQETALHHGARCKNPNVITFLLDHDAFVNIASSAGYTPLLLTVDQEDVNIEVVMLLCEAGANIEAPDLFGERALHFSASYGNGWLVRYLLQRGASVSAISEKGHTALMKAAMCAVENQDIIMQLLHAGASIDTVDTNGRTALHHASAVNAVSVLTLLEAGADGRIQDKCGNTPVDVARNMKLQDIVELLVTFGRLPDLY